MQLAVIIPCYNSASWVAETLDSVLRQTAPPAEIIVVNDGSTDNSAEVLRGYGDRIRVVEQENRGLGGARNSGARAAASPWLTFLDADDLYEPNFVEAAGQLVKAFPETKLHYTDCRTFAGNETLVPSLIEHYMPGLENTAERREGDLLLMGHSFTRRLIERNGTFPPSTMIVHRDLFERAEGFYEGMNGTEDLDFYVRVAPGTKIGVVRQPLLLKREVPASLGRAHKVMRPAVDIFYQRAKEHCSRHHPEILPTVREKYLGLLASWGAKEQNLGLHAAACQTFKQALCVAPFSARLWRGFVTSAFRRLLFGSQPTQPTPLASK